MEHYFYSYLFTSIGIRDFGYFCDLRLGEQIIYRGVYIKVPNEILGLAIS